MSAINRFDRAATPLEAYLSGVIHSTGLVLALPDHLHLAPVTNANGEVTGEIEVHTQDVRVRASILVTERSL